MQEINKKNIRIWSRLGQRGTICGVALPEIASKKENCYVITADLAQLSSLERLKTIYPSKFINIGISEQNMIGVAGGLALEGNCVFATTYATFLTMRCYEQIRHNLGYQKANVKLLGSSSGLAMGMSGNTHYTYEDIAIMRVIPNMIVLSPADATEAYRMVHMVSDYEEPVYIRLSGALNNEIVYEDSYLLEIGKAITLRQGQDTVVIATGSMVIEALKAAKLLEEKGISIKVINMHTIKPLDTEILESISETNLIITLEEHSIIGGLGSAVAEYFSSKKIKPRQIMLGLPDAFLKPAEYEYLKQQNGLYAENIAAIVEKNLEES